MFKFSIKLTQPDSKLCFQFAGTIRPAATAARSTTTAAAADGQRQHSQQQKCNDLLQLEQERASVSVTIHPSSTCVDDASVLVASSKGMVELWVLGGGGGGDARGESAFV